MADDDDRAFGRLVTSSLCVPCPNCIASVGPLPYPPPFVCPLFDVRLDPTDFTERRRPVSSTEREREPGRRRPGDMPKTRVFGNIVHRPELLSSQHILAPTLRRAATRQHIASSFCESAASIIAISR